MRRLVISVFSLFVTVALVVSVIPINNALTADLTAHLTVSPAANTFYTNTTSVGQTFKISVGAYLPSVSPFYGWEFILAWNASLINCTSETVNTGIWSAYLGPWIAFSINNVAGQYHQSLTGKAPGTAVAGTFWLTNLTFVITKAPADGKTLSCGLNLLPAPGYIYCLLDIDSNEIVHTFDSGSYQFISSAVGPPETKYKLDISVNNATMGSTDKSSGLYNLGDSVNVTATPNSGYNFTLWTLDGAGAGTANPIKVTMNANHTLIAAFSKSGPPPAGIHDIAVKNMTSRARFIGQNYTVQINVTVENQGDFSENVNLTLSVTLGTNKTTIGNQIVNNVGSKTEVLMKFMWNTTGFAKGNYTVTAYAQSVPSETDVGDNTGTDWILVTIGGDVNGDKRVDFGDAIVAGAAFGSKPGDPRWNPNADLNGDGYINIKDIMRIGAKFGQSWA